MPTDFLNTITRARAASHDLPRRVVASLARYAVLGLVALSILPTTYAAEANHTLATQDQSNAQGDAQLALDKQIAVTINAESDLEQRASVMANLIGVAAKHQSNKKTGTDETVAWNNMKVSASGKVLTLKLEMSREAAGNLLLKQITPN